MSQTPKERLTQDIVDFLTINEQIFSIEDNGRILLYVNAPGAIKTNGLIISVKDAGYTVYALLPIYVDAEDLSAVKRATEFICRLNNELERGSFEFDVNDGELRFKYDVIFAPEEDMNLPYEIITKSLSTPCEVIKKYGRAFLELLFNNGDPEDLILESRK